MSEPENTAQPQKPARQFAIQKIFIKDSSFESPNAPEIFTKKWEPEINMQMTNKHATLGEGVYEVILSLTLTAKLAKKTAYLVEVQQAGIFNIQGFEKDELNTMVGSYCLNILFPFAREAVSDVVTKGGFPQQLLPPVNFDALYAESLQQRKKQQNAERETKH
jgi:preprotein translocase subunit SecB